MFRGLGLHLGIAAASHGHKNVRMNRRTAALGHRCAHCRLRFCPATTTPAEVDALAQGTFIFEVDQQPQGLSPISG
jgi:hypothetical protein